MHKKNNHEINWHSNFIFETNSLNQLFLDGLLNGEYINDSTKSQWLNLAKQSNTIHSTIKNGIEYSYSFGNKFLAFSASDINHLNANIRKDLIKLVLKGNYDYQNETLNFSNSNIRADRYQQYKLTYGIKRRKNRCFSWNLLSCWKSSSFIYNKRRILIYCTIRNISRFNI